MVGRIAQEPFETTSSQRATLRDLGGLDDVDDALAEIVPRYNLAPTQSASILIRHQTGLHVERMSWRLWPKHEKNSNFRYSTFNARVEDVHQLWSFRSAFKDRRGLIPLRGFFEWQTLPDGSKQPHFFQALDESALWAATVWEPGQQQDGAVTRPPTFAIVTKPAVDPVAALHHRMPVLLHQSQWSTWLCSSPTLAREIAQADLQVELTVYPVSRAVNGTAVDSRHLIDPVSL